MTTKQINKLTTRTGLSHILLQIIFPTEVSRNITQDLFTSSTDSLRTQDPHL